MEEKNGTEIRAALFINLVSSLYSSSMHFMGKIMNPVTGKIEKNLEAARTNIEMLRMLREKTRGNLLEEESRILGDAISNMQMNYVDEAGKSKTGETCPPGADGQEPAENDSAGTGENEK